MHGCSSLDHVRTSTRMYRLHADLFLLFAAVDLGPRIRVPEVGHGPRRPAHLHRRARRVAALALLPLAIQEARDRPEGDGRGLAFCRSPSGAGVAFFIGGWLQQAGIDNRHRHQHRLPDRPVRRHHPVHRLGLERQAAEPAGVAGGRRCLRSAPGCSAAARSAPSRPATCWWRSRPCSGPPCRDHRPRRAVPPADRIHGRAVRDRGGAGGAGALLLETVTLAGLTAAWRRHRLRRAAVERAHLHAADRGPAAHASLGGRRHRQHGGAVCRARRLPAPRTST